MSGRQHRAATVRERTGSRWPAWVRSLTVAALCCGSLLAQARPAARKKAPASERWPLAAIHVTGNKVFPSEAIVKASGLKLGEVVRVVDLQRAVDRLTATGAFETISFRYGPEGEKLGVTFEVQEVIDLYPVAFERLGIPDAELGKVLAERVPLFGPHAPATGPMVKRIADAIQAYLAEKGKGAAVAGKLLPDANGKLVMTFRSTEALPVVTFVRFEKMTVLTAEDLQKAFYQTALGVPYTEERLLELLDSNIRLLFEEKGRLRVRFGPLRTEESKQATGVEVIVPVEEGDGFHFGKVQFTGNKLLPERTLARMVKLEEGELANFALVNQGVTEVEGRYHHEGYMQAKATVQRTLDDGKKTVDLLIGIREGDQYTMRALTIKGLDINAEAAVRQRWAIKRGQPFDGTYPEIFLKRIEEEAMFEGLGKTAFHIQVDEAAKMVNVELVFQGAPPARRKRNQN